jgi:hypothetical protein
MTSNYSYKGVHLSQIYVNNELSTAPFVGMPKSNSDLGITYNGMRPLKFGYFDKGIDLCTKYTATSVIYDVSPLNVYIPIGVKSCRMVSIGGKGGSGGDGADSSGQPAKGSTTTGVAGVGGLGGFGNYESIDNLTLPSPDKYIMGVVVGTAGTAGTPCNDIAKANSQFIDWTHNSAKNQTVKSGDGGDGGSGNESYITIQYDSDLPVKHVTAAGGNGGKGGIGGKSNASMNNSTSNNIAENGMDGKTEKYPVSNMYHLPTNGDDGFVQIIWLYD